MEQISCRKVLDGLRRFLAEIGVDASISMMTNEKIELSVEVPGFGEMDVTASIGNELFISYYSGRYEIYCEGLDAFKESFYANMVFLPMAKKVCCAYEAMDSVQTVLARFTEDAKGSNIAAFSVLSSSKGELFVSECKEHLFEAKLVIGDVRETFIYRLESLDKEPKLLMSSSLYIRRLKERCNLSVDVLGNGMLAVDGVSFGVRADKDGVVLYGTDGKQLDIKDVYDINEIKVKLLSTDGSAVEEEKKEEPVSSEEPTSSEEPSDASEREEIIGRIKSIKLVVDGDVSKSVQVITESCIYLLDLDKLRNAGFPVRRIRDRVGLINRFGVCFTEDEKASGKYAEDIDDEDVVIRQVIQQVLG